MKVFKNSVGRPSNDTLKKRRNIIIICASLIVVFLIVGVLLITKLFNKNDVIGDSKNAKSIAISYQYNTSSSSTTIALGKNVTFKHTISNMGTKTYYQKYIIYKNGSASTKSKCTPIKPSGGKYVENDTLTAESNGTTKYMHIEIYSDSNCKTTPVKLDSKKFKWGSASTGSGDTSGTCEKGNYVYKVNGKEYCTPPQHKNYNYSKLHAQPSGNKQCLGYAVSYVYAWTKGKYLSSYATSVAESHYNKFSAGSLSNYYDSIRKVIKGNNGCVVWIKNASGNSHYIAIIGVLKSSMNKSKDKLSYSDFLAIDPNQKKIANWGSLISGINRTYMDFSYRIVY